MTISLENRIPPPLVTVMIGLAMWALSRILPAVQVADVVRYGLAGLLLAFGGIVAGLAISGFRRVGTTINPVEIDTASSLVTTGIYAFTRNPMYVGLTTLLVTLAVLLSGPWLLGGPLLFALYTTRFQIIPEERAMQAKFGPAYDDYKARVRRWL